MIAPAFYFWPQFDLLEVNDDETKVRAAEKRRGGRAIAHEERQQAQERPLCVCIKGFTEPTKPVTQLEPASAFVVVAAHSDTLVGTEERRPFRDRASSLLTSTSLSRVCIRICAACLLACIVVVDVVALAAVSERPRQRIEKIDAPFFALTNRGSSRPTNGTRGERFPFPARRRRQRCSCWLAGGPIRRGQFARAPAPCVVASPPPPLLLPWLRRRRRRRRCCLHFNSPQLN